MEIFGHISTDKNYFELFKKYVQLVFKYWHIPWWLENPRVTPIFKSDNKTDCGNCRPISIISNVDEIFEKAVYSQLSTFLNENKVIVENQSGFRRNYSTETTLLHSIINY